MTETRVPYSHHDHQTVCDPAPYLVPPPPFPGEPPAGLVTLSVPGVTVEAARRLEHRAHRAGLSWAEFLCRIIEQIGAGPLHLYWPQIEAEGIGCIVMVPHFQFQATPQGSALGHDRTLAGACAHDWDEEPRELDDRV
jgi:hypothetical protein